MREPGAEPVTRLLTCLGGAAVSELGLAVAGRLVAGGAPSLPHVLQSIEWRLVLICPLCVAGRSGLAPMAGTGYLYFFSYFVTA